MSTDIDKQLEAYRYKQYRRKRVRFYILATFTIILGAVLLGVYAISNKPIDVTTVEEADSAIEVAEEEFGDTYIRTLENLPTIGYETQYEALRNTYEELLTDGASEEDKNRVALDLVVFVEFVQRDSEKAAERYGLSGTSRRFYHSNERYLEKYGEVVDILEKLTKHHSKSEEDLEVGEVRLLLRDLDRRMDMYTKYLTSLKNTL